MSNQLCVVSTKEHEFGRLKFAHLLEWNLGDKNTVSIVSVQFSPFGEHIGVGYVWYMA